MWILRLLKCDHMVKNKLFTEESILTEESIPSLNLYSLIISHNNFELYWTQADGQEYIGQKVQEKWAEIYLRNALHTSLQNCISRLKTKIMHSNTIYTYLFQDHKITLHRNWLVQHLHAEPQLSFLNKSWLNTDFLWV